MEEIKWLFKMCPRKLTPAAGTLTGGRSLISKAGTKVETPKLWAVCSITICQYLKMRRPKLNAHTEASDIWCACIRIRSWNEWHEIGGACYECRCEGRSCWPRLSFMFWTQGWFLGLKKLPINALHIVDQLEGQREKDLDYLSQTQLNSYGTHS